MATIKSYTDLQQSRKLAEILPLESADMYYDDIIDSVTGELFIPADGSTIKIGKGLGGSIAAWSLAALLSVLPNGTDVVKEETDTENEKYMCTVGIKDDIISTFANTPIDACVAMIEELNELNLL